MEIAKLKEQVTELQAQYDRAELRMSFISMSFPYLHPRQTGLSAGQ